MAFFAKKSKCYRCDGSGRVDCYQSCSRCDETGIYNDEVCYRCGGNKRERTGTETCGDCEGKGHITTLVEGDSKCDALDHDWTYSHTDRHSARTVTDDQGNTYDMDASEHMVSRCRECGTYKSDV